MEHTCEECGKGTAKRVLSAPRIVFKGSGWYATDSRNKTAAVADNDTSSGDSSKPEKSDSSKSSDSPSPAAGSSTETASAAS
jgi:predicted nucleic acid-binding Zn ribbon protein